MAHTAQGTREQIHQSAEEVSQGGVGKNFHTALDNIFFRSVNVQQFRSENIDKDAHDERYGNGQNHTVPEYPVHALILADTVILTGKTHAGLCDGIDGNVHKSENIVGGGVTGHGCRTERVDRGLQQYIRKVNDGTLDTCRNTHLKNLFHIQGLDFQL